jgi:hypothetical protein
MINDFTGRHVKVQTEGGTINVEWRDDDQLVMTGRADLVFRAAGSQVKMFDARSKQERLVHRITGPSARQSIATSMRAWKETPD